MRLGLVMFMVSMWVGLTILGNISEQEAFMTQPIESGSSETQEDTLQALREAEFQIDTNPITAIPSAMSDIWNFMKTLGKIMFLYYPALWQGSGIWLYYFLILPFSIATLLMFLAAIRGVASQ